MQWLKEFLKEIENGEELEKKIAEKIKESYVSKGEYDALEQKYKTDTQNLEKKYTESRKHSAVDMAILQAKGKNTKALKHCWIWIKSA